MSDLELFKEKTGLFLREYVVLFRSAPDGKGEEVLRDTDIHTEIGAEQAVWEAIRIILARLRAEALDLFPPNSFPKLYLWPPEKWEWCHGHQMEWGPSRLFFDRDGYNVKLCMGFMVKGEK